MFVDPIIPTRPSFPKVDIPTEPLGLKVIFEDFAKISRARSKSRFDSNAALRHKFTPREV